MTTPASLSPNFSSPPTNWWGRNWKWVVPVGLLAAALLLAAFIGGIFWIVQSSFQHSSFYGEALTRARANPQVIAKIGQPLEPGWFTSGSINTSGSTGSADVAIPISGPKGKGTIHVVARKNAGKWRFETLQVEFSGEADRLDLLRPEDAAPQEN